MLPLLLASATALTVGIIDHRTGRMPNRITLPSLLLALGYHWLVGGVHQGTLSILGLFLVGVAPLLMFLFTRGEAIGGGDVKALAALGAWLGPSLGLELTFLSFSLLATFALFQSIKKGDFLALLGRSFLRRKSTKLASERITMRFGPFLALGTLICCAYRAFELSSLGDLLS